MTGTIVDARDAAAFVRVKLSDGRAGTFNFNDWRGNGHIETGQKVTCDVQSDQGQGIYLTNVRPA